MSSIKECFLLLEKLFGEKLPEVNLEKMNINENNSQNLEITKNNKKLITKDFVKEKNAELFLGKKRERNNEKGTQKSKLIFNLKKVTDKQKEKKLEQKAMYRGSKYRGVSKNGNCWQVLIMYDRHKYYIGNFKSEDEAAKVYDECAIKYHKEKAILNFYH